MFLKKIILGVVAICLAACTPPVVREATGVVSQADSLRADGKMYEDSAQLAQAYETFGKWKWFYADEYAHACYHYGRLLREKDDPVGAMECFINATHTCTRDYPILGRVYSNMGEIAHLASEYPLSYDMFERSADMFLQSGDSIAYFYALNDMAYEKAEQGAEEETLQLLDTIETQCFNNDVLIKIKETKAEMYLKCQQYDSAIYNINRLKRLGYNEPTGTLIKAQAFSYLGVNDSAIYFANMVLNDAYASSQNRFNALYVLSHNDTTLCTEEIRDIASRREDIRYYEYEPKMEKLTQAIYLLRHEAERIATYRKIRPYIVIAILVLLSIIVYGIYRSKNKHRVLETALLELDKREKDIIVQQIQTRQKQSEYTQQRKVLYLEIENRCQLLRATPDLKENLHWRQYDAMCQTVDSQFYMFASKLRQLPYMKERDVQLCVLVLLDFNHTEIAKLMYVEGGSVGKLKERTAKKLHTSRKNMRQTLLKIVIGDDFEFEEM